MHDSRDVALCAAHWYDKCNMSALSLPMKKVALYSPSLHDDCEWDKPKQARGMDVRRMGSLSLSLSLSLSAFSRAGGHAAIMQGNSNFVRAVIPGLSTVGAVGLGDVSGAKSSVPWGKTSFQVQPSVSASIAAFQLAIVLHGLSCRAGLLSLQHR